MKNKILCFIIAVLLLVPCLCLNVCAENDDVIILNEGQNLQYQGNYYIRFDGSLVYFESEESLLDVKYDDIKIRNADYEISKKAVMITAYFNYRDGSTLTAYFIDQRYYDEYLSISENNSNYSINFYYPDEVVVPATKNTLFGPKTTISENELLFCDEYDVTVQDPDQIYSIETGRLLISDDDYYYVDYKEAEIYDPLEFYPSEMQSLEVHRITDEQLCEQIDVAYGNDGIDLFNSDFFGGISTVFVIFIFAIIPLVVLVLFIILYIRAKTTAYKKLFLSILITAATELVIFIVTIVLLMVFK